MNGADIHLETDRLLLRLPRLEDFEPYAELHADDEAARYIGGALTRAAAWRKFLQMPGAWMVQGFAMFSVVEKASGRWLGQLGPWQPEGWPGTEIGWAFHPSAWGKGYATEAGTAALDWAFERLGWDEVIHSIHPDNRASQALAARLGSRNRGPGRLPPPYQDSPTEIWAQTRAEWAASRAGRHDSDTIPTQPLARPCARKPGPHIPVRPFAGDRGPTAAIESPAHPLEGVGLKSG